MAETIRTQSALLSLLADNTAGDISAQDLRDMMVSLQMQHGQVSVSGNTTATVVSDTTNWFELDATGVVLSGVSQLISGNNDFDNPTGERLRYLGTTTRMFHCIATLSFTCAANNQEIHIRFGKNGTPSAEAEIRHWISTGTDVGSSAIHWITSLSQNDYVTAHVKNITSAANVTIVSFNIQAMGMM